MTDIEVLSELDLEDRYLLSLQLLFEERKAVLVIEDDDENDLVLELEAVASQHISEPLIPRYPDSRMIAFQYERKHRRLHEIKVFLDISGARACQIITIRFERLHIYKRSAV